MQSEKIIATLKGRVAKGLNFGIEAIEEILNPASEQYNRFILLKSKYNDLMYISSENTLPYDQIELGLDRLRSKLLKIIDNLQETDFEKKEVNSSLNVNALSNRRINFFNLLEIHFKNLNSIVYREETYLSEGTSITTKQGREACQLLRQSACYQFSDTFKASNPQDIEKIEGFFKEYFEARSVVFEVYFKTLKHLLQYIHESEIEQAFFINTLKAQISRYEQFFLFYYALCKIDADYHSVLKNSQLLSEIPVSILIHREHLKLYE